LKIAITLIDKTAAIAERPEVQENPTLWRAPITGVRWGAPILLRMQSLEPPVSYQSVGIRRSTLHRFESWSMSGLKWQLRPRPQVAPNGSSQGTKERPIRRQSRSLWMGRIGGRSRGNDTTRLPQPESKQGQPQVQSQQRTRRRGQKPALGWGCEVSATRGAIIASHWCDWRNIAIALIDRIVSVMACFQQLTRWRIMRTWIRGRTGNALWPPYWSGARLQRVWPFFSL